MAEKKGFTIVEVLVVVVILAVIGLIIMISIIPRIEQNAINNFINDTKLYLQAATNHFSDIKVDDAESKGGCISIKELNKTNLKVSDKNDYKGYIEVVIGEKTTEYKIAITNQRYYSYNRTYNTYELDSGDFIDDNILTDYENVKDFPSKCPNK